MTTSFPDGFLWGVATAGHQVEGNNTNADVWLFENVEGTIYAEPSGIAVDHWNRYKDDIALFASLGLNAYRFSLEWPRIEPREGEFDAEAIEHYRDVIRTCHENNLTPIVTYHHFTSPVWLLAKGGWESDETPELFARYCQRVTEELGEDFEWACTMNEPNLALLLAEMGFSEREPAQRIGMPMWESVARELGITADRVAGFQLTATPKAVEIKTAAHRAAVVAIKAVKPEMKVGWTLANTEFHAINGGEEKAAELRQAINIPFLEVSRDDDFVGIQTYNRTTIDAHGVAEPPEGAVLNSQGEEIWAPTIGVTVKEAWDIAGVPVMVTENGLATDDDTQRVDFLRGAIASVKANSDAGVPVLGYMCWTAIDNFEWIFGYRPKMGVIAVNRDTMERSPKPSAYVLGEIARSNGAEGL
ncbi:MAG: family 1 glycosylhydrolase [Actinomycetaceae bacterium]|nr:family 1 glycosylhydrolase [Actinomycetaceae bacterium]